jgi:RNA polymerase sigma factor (TIGR02999 family)
MTGPTRQTVTELLHAWSRGDTVARDQLLPLVYSELRRRAASYLRRERAGHTLQPTALVHEAYLRLCEQNAGWKNREQFFALASRIMRRVLVDHARARKARKRATAPTRVTLADSSESREIDLIALDEALDELAGADERQARIVELRYFGGLRLEEVASALDVSLATVNREWRSARAWLFQRMG